MDRSTTSAMLLEARSDSKLAASVLRIVYAFVLASLAILFCGIATLCNSVICYELLLLKNAFYIAVYFLSMCFLLIFFMHIYSSSKKKRVPIGNEAVMSTISSFQHQRIADTERQASNTLPAPVRPPRHHYIPAGAQRVLPSENSLPLNNINNMINNQIITGSSTLPIIAKETPGAVEPLSIRHNNNNNNNNGILSSLRNRDDRVWPIHAHPDENNMAMMSSSLNQMNQQSHQTGIIIGGMKASKDKLFVLPEISNLILKLFVIALSFPSMLYAVFRLAVAAERYSHQYDEDSASPCLITPIEIVQFAFLIFLIPMQAFYVFKYGRVFSRRCPMLSAFALTHLLAANFATWFEMFTTETTRFHFRTYTAVFDYYPLNATLSSAVVKAAGVDEAESSYSFCFDSATTIRRASSEAAPFLYPLFTHYLLLVSIPLLRLLFAVTAENCVDEDDAVNGGTIQLHSLEDDGRLSSQTNNNFDGPCDCRHSNKGIFVNLVVIVALTSLILAAHFLSPTTETVTTTTGSKTGNAARSATIRLAYYTAQIGINSVVILAVPLAWRGLYQLDRVPHRDFSPDPRRSVHQYNVARCAVTFATLGFTLIYYLAIIIAHSATLAQLVIHYWYYHGEKTIFEEGQPEENGLGRSSSISLRGGYVYYQHVSTSTTTTPETTVTKVAQFTSRTQRPAYGVFFLACQNSVPEKQRDEIAREANALATSPTITVPAIVASALAIGRAVSSMLLAVIQVILTVMADCRSALTDKQLDRKPGRSLVMFILTASLIGWALEIAFELHTSSIGDAVATFHSLSPSIFDIGNLIWPLFSVFTIPHMLAFRLCIAVWLYDNWLNCYSPTVI